MNQGVDLYLKWFKVYKTQTNLQGKLMARPKRGYKVIKRDVPEELWPELARRIEDWKLEQKGKK